MSILTSIYPPSPGGVSENQIKIDRQLPPNPKFHTFQPDEKSAKKRKLLNDLAV
jgi:hypothetical protein